jgi:hypothetical protein
MKCQALANELARLRAEIARGPNDGERDRCKELGAAADAIEEEIAHAIGTPGHRALEAAQAEAEGSLKEALLEDAVRGTPGSRAAVEYQRTKLAALRVAVSQPSPYTSEAEEKLARVRAQVADLRIGKDGWQRRIVELQVLLGDA